MESDKTLSVLTMKIINMTPHGVTIVDSAGAVVKEIPASGNTIRLSTSIEMIGHIDGIFVSKTIFGDPVGLPSVKDGVYYIVSQLVKSALPDRKDLLVPAQVVRDKDGNIIGCQSLGL